MAGFPKHLDYSKRTYRHFQRHLEKPAFGFKGLFIAFFCLSMVFTATESLYGQDKTHSKKLEKVKKKKNKKNKDRKASRYQGKIEPSATPAVKGNPTRKSKKTSGRSYQERVGNDNPPRGTKGTKFAGKNKSSKSIDKTKGTRHRGDPVPTEPRISGNPTKKKSTSGVKYQQRVGNDGPPSRTEGTSFRGRSRPKSINKSQGSNYKGEVVPIETRVKGNPTKKIDRRGKSYQERTGQQGPPSGTPGTRFAGKGRPKTIKGSSGTTYEGQSTAGSTSSAGGRTTIYGERGKNFQKSGVPEIKKRDQGAQWRGNLKGAKSIEGTAGTNYQGNLKGNKSIARSPGSTYRGNLKSSKIIEGTPGTNWKGNTRMRTRKIYDYGGDWSGNLKLKKPQADTRASTFAIKGMRPKEVPQGPGTTYRGNMKSSKKIVNWDGADFQGHLKVRPNQKTKTPGTTFAGHYKVSRNSRIKTEGVDFQGNYKTSTRFFKNRHFKQKSRQEQLFAGNYKVRRTKGKDLHPSATYSGGRLKDPNKRDEFSRRWKLLLAKTQKNADQPKHLKTKTKKPKYDPKQKDLWYD